MQKASEFNYREATTDEDKRLVEMADNELSDFLEEAEVVHNGTGVLAVVDGIAYHLEELAKRRN